MRRWRCDLTAAYRWEVRVHSCRTTSESAMNVGATLAFLAVA